MNSEMAGAFNTAHGEQFVLAFGGKKVSRKLKKVKVLLQARKCQKVATCPICPKPIPQTFPSAFQFTIHTQIFISEKENCE